MTHNRSRSPISRTPSQGRCQDQTLLKLPIPFNKTTDPQILRSQQDLNETSILTRTNSDHCLPAGSVGLILSAGPTMSIIIRGARRGIGPRQIKRSTTVPKTAKRMPLATITTVVFLLMTCWRPRIPLRLPGTRLQLLTQIRRASCRERVLVAV